MARLVELLQLTDDGDERAHLVGIAGGLELVAAQVEVESGEDPLERAEVRLSGAEELDEVDRVRDDEADGLRGRRVRCGR